MSWKALLFNLTIITISIFILGHMVINNAANSVEMKHMYLVPEKTNATCEVYRMDDHTILFVVDENKLKEMKVSK